MVETHTAQRQRCRGWGRQSPARRHLRLPGQLPCARSAMSCVPLLCLGDGDADFTYHLPPTARLALAVNPNSGDHTGARWLAWFAETHPQVQLLDLTRSDTELLGPGAVQLEPPLDRVLVAGGDGVRGLHD